MSSDLTDIAEASVRGGFFLFTGNAFSTLILAVNAILVGRLLGPENYGVYSLALVVPLLLSSFVDFGMNTAIIRFSAKLMAEGQSNRVASMLKSGFVFKFLMGSALSAFCFLASGPIAIHILHRAEMAYLLRIAAPLILLQVILRTMQSSFIGLERIKNSVGVLSLQSITKTLISSFLLVGGFSVIGALIGHISGFVLATLIGGLLLLKQYLRLEKPTSSGYTRDLKVMLSYGLPLYLSTLLNLLINQYTNIILAIYASNTEIGNFKVATTLSSAMTLFVYPLSILFLAFSKMNQHSPDLKKLFRISVKYTTLLLTPVTIFGIIASREIVYTFYGQRYDLAPFFLSLYILTFLYSGLGFIVIGHLLTGLGKTKTVLKANLIGVVFRIPLTIILMTFYGVPGLITALLISSFFVLLYMLHVISQKFKLHIDLKASLKIGLVSLMSNISTLLILQFSPLSVQINLVISGIIYLCTLLTTIPLTKTVSRGDLLNFKKILDNLHVPPTISHLILKYEEMLLTQHAL